MEFSPRIFIKRVDSKDHNNGKIAIWVSHRSGLNQVSFTPVAFFDHDHRAMLLIAACQDIAQEYDIPLNIDINQLFPTEE